MITGQVKKFAMTGGVNINSLLRFVVSLLIAPVILLGLASCTSNDDEDNPNDNNDNKQVTVTINLSTDTPSTRATITPTWEGGSADENMKSWIVVITDKEYKIVKVINNTNDISSGVEKDTYTLSLATGDYYFYSFANITEGELGNPQKDGTASFEDMPFAVNGNDFDTSKAGIPMSNKQEVSITESTTGIDLWVVRMLAKVTLKFINSTSSPITIKSISLSDITENASDNDNKKNLMLMPEVVNKEDEEACTPNLIDGVAYAEYTYTINDGLTVPTTATAYSDEYSVSFYVNESVAHNPSYFVVTLNTTQGEQRYALFDDWTTIARNDHHILPINLNDYKIKFTVESFTAIGVYPSVEDDGKQLSLTFHLPEEEFHIIPTVTKLSTDETVTFNKTSEYVTWTKLTETLPTGMFLEEPEWNSTLGYIEGVMGGTLGQRHESLYQLQIEVEDGLELTYKVQINQDLTWYTSSSSGVKDKRTSLPRQWQTVYVSE